MKISEMPEQVQVVAAQLLATKLDEHLLFASETRTEKAEKIAQAVRKAFESLYD
ncbi:hypothetical protein V2154_16750 [Ewingella sp. CoE-038-23]|uniref:hypothetical protein n=1 Tax=Ewingella docleensis TaxID=3118588 RepID=UPI0033654CF7